jgi:thioredoxin reductase (NADPH)
MYDLIIIGAGPAGLTAAIYAGRFRLETLILEKMVPGGQIIMSSDIENYPGFPGGISTQELIERFKKQVDDLGIKIETEDVLEIIRRDKSYTIKTQSNSYEAKCVVIASGAQPKMLGAAGEEKFIGRGVSYCGTCDGPLFKNKEIVVVGGGDRALEETLFLSVYASKVNLVHRRDQLRASRILEEKAKKNPKINFILENTLQEINGKDKVESVRIKNVKTGKISDLACQGVFIFVGIKPNTGFLNNLLQLDQTGFIITDADMATAQAGIFACGDCRKKSLYQVINACAEGAVAVNSAHNYLLKL